MHCIRYTVQLGYEVLDDTVDLILNIEASRTGRQRIVTEQLELPAGLPHAVAVDPVTGNRMLRLKAPRGHVSLRYAADVELDPRLDDPDGLTEMAIADLPFEVLPYLSPSRYCESDRLLEFALREFGQAPRGYARVQAIRDWVNGHVRFQPQGSRVTTSATDTLVERVGVCRDFAHLMVALCRACSIPARFSGSIDFGADPSLGPPDFHAFVEVFLSGSWYVFDPSGLSVPSGLLRIGTGRDAADIPFATIYGRTQADVPRITMDALVDPAQGWTAPEPVSQALCLS